jgi:hypothetical protein
MSDIMNGDFEGFGDEAVKFHVHFAASKERLTAYV